jgi:hypothetical protein
MDTANQSMKPKWTPTGHLLYAQSGLPTTAPTTTEWRDVRLVAGQGSDVMESVPKGADKDVSLISLTNSLSACPSRTLEVIVSCIQPDGKLNLVVVLDHLITSDFHNAYLS